MPDPAPMNSAGEVVMRNSRFLDRCFVAVVFLALAALLGGTLFSLFDSEPRQSGPTLLLRVSVGK